MEYLKKIWNILSQEYKKKIIILFLFVIFSVFLEVLGISLVVPLVVFLLEDNIIGEYPFLKDIINLLTNYFSKENLNKICLLSILTVYFIKNLLLSVIFI